MLLCSQAHAAVAAAALTAARHPRHIFKTRSQPLFTRQPMCHQPLTIPTSRARQNCFSQFVVDSTTLANLNLGCKTACVSAAQSEVDGTPTLSDCHLACLTTHRSVPSCPSAVLMMRTAAARRTRLFSRLRVGVNSESPSVQSCAPCLTCFALWKLRQSS